MNPIRRFLYGLNIATWKCSSNNCINFRCIKNLPTT